MADVKKNITVSVSMITYLHEQFIAEAIESIVNQKTNFDFELVIGEDCGPDGTREICKAYQKKYPDIIRLNFKDHNVGPQPNFIATLNMCRGQYIALCEGDDYWTDPHKLQKQVDFLQSNPDYSMCGHAASILQGGEFRDCTIDETSLTTEDLLRKDWGIMTASILFRRDALNLPDWFVNIKNGDFGLQLLLSLNGKIGYIKDKMSVYRMHPGGLSNTLRPFEQAAWLTYLLYEFDKTTKGKYRKQIRKRIGTMYKKQLGFAKEYNLRRAWAKLKYFEVLSIFAPFMIKNNRK